jgi:hypothetical protein
MAATNNQPTVNKESILAFQNMDCEKYQTEEERGNCYDTSAKETANFQGQKAVEKAIIGSFVTLMILALMGVGVYFGGTYIKKRLAQKKALAGALTTAAVAAAAPALATAPA